MTTKQQQSISDEKEDRIRSAVEHLYDEYRVAPHDERELVAVLPAFLLTIQGAWNLTELPGDAEANHRRLMGYLLHKLFPDEPPDLVVDGDEKRYATMSSYVSAIAASKRAIIGPTGLVLWRLSVDDAAPAGQRLDELEVKPITWFSNVINAQANKWGWC